MAEIININKITHGFEVQFGTQESAEKACKIFDEGAQWLNTYYGAILDAADFALFDVVELLKKKGQWKREVKFRTKRTQELMNGITKKLREGVRIQLYLDMLDMYQDVMKPDISRLHKAVTKRLHNLGVGNAGYAAHIEVVTILVGIAQRVYDWIIKDVNEAAGMDVARFYTPEINPKNLIKRWFEALPVLIDYDRELSRRVLKDDDVGRLVITIQDKVTTDEGSKVVMALTGYKHPEVLEAYAAEVPDVDIDALKAYAEQWHKRHMAS